MTKIKTRLRVLRAEREWSQAKLAAQVRVTRQTINSIETGRYHPNLRLAFKIARAFGKLIQEVFIYEDIQKVGSWCLLFYDLPLAPCVLHATELGCPRCGRAVRYAAQQPGDETPVSAGARKPGSRAPRTGKRESV